MEQSKYFPCSSCQAPVPAGHKFCGRCGQTSPPELVNLDIKFFGELQDPSKASLVVVRGEGQEGLSYHLRASEHVLGKAGQIQFDDPFISDRHANLYYRGSQLTLRDEKSENGTYIRIRGKTKLAMGDLFIAGDQVMRVEPMPTANEDADATGTYFYGSPTFRSNFRIVQLLEGGETGLVFCPRETRATIGRQGCDMNFFGDTHLSEEHCSIEQDQDGFTLTDLDSKNGTYVRLKGEKAVDHGDYFIVGRKLLRVELNA